MFEDHINIFMILMAKVIQKKKFDAAACEK